MRLPTDELFVLQRTTLPLRHCCEDCGLFDAQTELCAHEWPTTEHRCVDYEGPHPLSTVNFCKEFELR